MKLHIYEHCPFCVRALMIFGLKKLPVAVSVIMEGDAETPTRMVGRKVVPILEKEDGTYMPESMDIVRYVDGLAASPMRRLMKPSNSGASRSPARCSIWLSRALPRAISPSWRPRKPVALTPSVKRKRLAI